MGLGIKPVKAAAVSLIANTAPVAFGALATPIVTLATVTSGVSDDDRLTVDTLGAMVGRQTPLLAVFVPLVLVHVVDGKRGLRQTWLPALTVGVTFGLAQFVASNYVSVLLTDIIASLVAAGAVVALLRVWTPVESPLLAESARGGESVPTAAGSHRGRAVPASSAGSRGSRSGDGDGDGGSSSSSGVPHDSQADVAKAYAPYLIIIAILSLTSLDSVKTALGKEPWTQKFAWPGLDVLTGAGEPIASGTFNFNWLPAAGTLMVFSGILTALLLKVSPGRALAVYRDTYVELKWAIVTVMAVLAVAYVMNQSAQTNTLGAFLAQTGGVFVLLSPILGWLGVAVTGSDTSANALFGALQVQTAAKAGLDPVLLAAANSSGGVMGKMVSPQNLAIAAAAVGMAGQEGVIFRKVLGWSLVLLILICALVGLQGTAVLDWMVPS
jgi:lactate permease